jgi:hypothetical protein
MKRRKHRKFRSIFVSDPIEPPERYLLTPTETSKALGISGHTLMRWRRTWLRDGVGDGPEPLRFGRNTFRYRRDEVCIPGKGQPMFLERMKQRLWDDIASEKTSRKTSTATMKGIK